jgi:transposase-like protein
MPYRVSSNAHMRRRSVPKTPQKIIDRAVKRHVEGRENADELAKEYQVSRASIYGWVAKFKQNVLDRSRRDGMTPLDADRADKADLIAQIEALELENKRLRDTVINMLLQTEATAPNIAAGTTGSRKPSKTAARKRK